ncbi:hypothetical protein LZ31DRAFT_598914 [Colletotrichum somersetense]|nr:hypothetical protein LZ31DRAFT_598914 [Colletotrichum somersetense]
MCATRQAALLTSTKTCLARPGEIEYLDDHDAKLARVSQVGASVPGMQGAAFWSALWTMPAGDVGKLLGELRTRFRAREDTSPPPVDLHPVAFLTELTSSPFTVRGPYERDPYGDAADSAQGTTSQQRWGIRLRFRWLKRTDVRDLNAPVGRVESGQVFAVTADGPDGLPEYDILLLQWDLLRIWRLAGGADPAVCYPFDSDDDDDDDDNDDDDETMMGR